MLCDAILTSNMKSAKINLLHLSKFCLFKQLARAFLFFR